ncbi:Signal transduction histidine kinase, core [Syntrophomonas zehnderi OL-4]|uniref:histidine kinase n=1 Tax=Syntrophomonas zehnderi OL-4 TaxID=690567 RepID=A0A0E4C7C2_9FIRM|nr:ATP-binding protein [Syntrophomonas zehnderi]CFW96830.1 Signal transduction histidine kinase, core [Syntrophomonas zehnderi OL-4]
MKKPGLANRITSTMVAVSIMAVIITSLTMLIMTRQQFSAYINKYDRAMLEQYVPIISDYYRLYGIEGLQEYLEFKPNNKGKSRGNGMGWYHRGQQIPLGKIRPGQRLIVADTKGMVMADTQGLLVGQPLELGSWQASSRPLQIDNKQIGTLYLISPLGSGLASMENDFINKLTVSTSVLALGIGLIALLLGLLLGKRISLPLADLSSAIHEVAQGKLNKRIELKGDQEFLELGRDFNCMAQKLEDYDRNRRRLTLDISHELRTPLTLLRGQLEAMQNNSINATPENVALLLDEVIRLTRLIKELEDLSQVENQAVVLHLSTFSIEDLLERLNPVVTAMQETGIIFTINADDNVNEITADFDRVLQILLNLLSNAMRHAGQEGMVSLTINRQDNNLQFAITDNGSGISAENLPHVFERFYRLDDSRNRLAGGMGLGLSIAKGYVEAHQGKIWVESKPGFETTFYFSLPQ